MAAVQKPLSAKSFVAKSGPPGWKHIKSWYLVSTNDQMIPPQGEELMAKRMGATVRSVPASHASMVAPQRGGRRHHTGRRVASRTAGEGERHSLVRETLASRSGCFVETRLHLGLFAGGIGSTIRLCSPVAIDLRAPVSKGIILKGEICTKPVVWHCAVGNISMRFQDLSSNEMKVLSSAPCELSRASNLLSARCIRV
jgi:hypothetical protein